MLSSVSICDVVFLVVVALVVYAIKTSDRPARPTYHVKEEDDDL